MGAGGLGLVRSLGPVLYPLGWGSRWQFLHRVRDRVVRSLRKIELVIAQRRLVGMDERGQEAETPLRRPVRAALASAVSQGPCVCKGQGYEDQRAAALSAVLGTKLAQMPQLALGRTLDMWVP